VVDREGALKYIARIKNDAKRGYALAWYNYCTGKNKTRPSMPKSLSFMACQGVRMNLDKDHGIKEPR
jgi:hypothetical protein